MYLCLELLFSNSITSLSTNINNQKLL